MRVVQRRTDAELIIVPDPQGDGEPIVIVNPDADPRRVNALARLLLPARQRAELARTLDGRRALLSVLAAALPMVALLGSTLSVYR